MDSSSPEPERRPLSFLAAASWTLMVAILGGVAVSILEAVHPGAESDAVTLAACRVLAYSLALFALLRMHDPKASIRRFIGLRRTSPALGALGLLAGAGLGPGAMWLNEQFAKRFPAGAEETAQLEHVFGVETLGRKISLVVALVIVLPIADEMFFRGVLFTPLKKERRAETVIVATAAYDTLLNGASPRLVVSMLAISLVLSWIRATTGSVATSVLARVGFFATQVLPIFLTTEEHTPGRIALGGTALAVAALLGLAAIARRSESAAEARTQDV